MAQENKLTSTKPGKKRGCRYWINLLGVGLIFGALMLYFGTVIVGVISFSNPANTEVCCFTPADLGYDYESITLTSDDGVNLSGWYIPSDNGAAIILLHGWGNNRLEMIWRAEILARYGYGVLMYDLRGHGESDAVMRTFGWEDVNDVSAALDYLQHREDVNPDRIGILGFSMGGGIAIRAAADLESIQAVIAEEPGFAKISDLPPRHTLIDRLYTGLYWFGLPGIAWRTGAEMPQEGVAEAVQDIAPRPILVIGSGPEDEMGYLIVRNFYDLAGDPKQFWSVPEAWHGGIPEVRPEEYEQQIIGFFDEALTDGD